MSKIRFAGKNLACRPKTATVLPSGCNGLQCAGLAEIFGSLEIDLHPNRVAAQEVVA